MKDRSLFDKVELIQLKLILLIYQMNIKIIIIFMKLILEIMKFK